MFSGKYLASTLEYCLEKYCSANLTIYINSFRLMMVMSALGQSFASWIPMINVTKYRPFQGIVINNPRNNLIRFPTKDILQCWW